MEVTSLQSVFTPHTVLVGLLVFLAAFWYIRRPKSLPPGPWFFFPGKKAHLEMTELSRKYGHIYRARVGPFLVGVVINDAKLFREVLIDNGEEFVDRNIPPLIRWISPIEGEHSV